MDASLKNGVLEDPEEHRATSAEMPQRPVGSVTNSSKGTRIPFTTQDDQALLEWVSDFVVKGGSIAGNKIYQQLAQHVR